MKVYIQHQPTRSIVSVLALGPEFPLSQALHENIERLNKISDVFYILPTEYPGIDPEKFTSLYGGLGWMISEGTVSCGVMGVIDYLQEIYPHQFAGFLIGHTNDLSEKDYKTDNILRLVASDIVKPVFKPIRLSSEDLYELYTRTPKTLWGEKIYPKEKENMFARYTSDSPLVLLKLSVIRSLLGFWKDPDTRGWIETFIMDDPKYMLASLIKYLGIDIIESNLEELEYGGSGS